MKIYEIKAGEGRFQKAKEATIRVASSMKKVCLVTDEIGEYSQNIELFRKAVLTGDTESFARFVLYDVIILHLKDEEIINNLDRFEFLCNSCNPGMQIVLFKQAKVNI